MMLEDKLIIVNTPNPKLEHGTQKNVSQTFVHSTILHKKLRSINE